MTHINLSPDKETFMKIYIYVLVLQYDSLAISVRGKSLRQEQSKKWVVIVHLFHPSTNRSCRAHTLTSWSQRSLGYTADRSASPLTLEASPLLQCSHCRSLVRSICTWAESEAHRETGHVRESSHSTSQMYLYLFNLSQSPTLLHKMSMYFNGIVWHRSIQSSA